MGNDPTPSVLSEEKRARLQALLTQEGLAKKPGGIPRADRAGPLPLSSGQERLWFLDQLEPGLAVYNIPAATWIDGPLAVEHLRSAFEASVARHEVLRTTFRADGGRPLQVIHEEARLPFEPVDLTGQWEEQEERDEQALRLANAAATESFDLAEGPLIRVFLWRTAPERHLLLVLMHHIVSEGATLSWMFEEVEEAYAALLEGRSPEIASPQVEYVDFASWQRDWLESGGADEDLSYWQGRLSGELVPLQLPSDRPRRASVSYAGAWKTRTLSPDLVEAVRARAKEERASLYMACHAALDVLFARYTGQEDLLVGGVVGLRPQKETERMFGFFIDTVVHRVDVSGDPSYRELLRRVRDETLDVLSHHGVPFERIVEAVQPDRDLNASPLLQVIYDHESVESIGGLHLKGTEPAAILRPEHVHNGCSKADLVFLTEESPEGLITSVEYDTHLFDASTIERMLDHFENLLRAVVADPDEAIGSMRMLSSEEEALVTGFNGPSREFPVACIHEELARLTALRPDAPALRCGERSVSRAQLDRRANRIAHRLVGRGIGPGAVVGICTERGFDMVAGALGILKAGAAYLPIDPKLPLERVAFLLEDSQAPLVLTEHALRERVGTTTDALLLDDPASGLDDEPSTAPECAATPDDVAYVIYTSGSTGRPKGVPIPHRNVARLMGSTAEWFAFDERDVWITLHSFGFDFSVWEVWGALMTGGTCVVASTEVMQSPDLRLEVCAREGVTVLNQTPSAFAQLIEAEEALAAAHAAGGPSLPALALRTVVFGGEALELSTLRPWFERHGDTRPQLVNMYGITETTVHVTYRPLSLADLDAGRGSVIGVPLPDLRVFVLDEARNPAPIGVPGELYVAGAGLAAGYLNRPELSAERFVPNHLEGTSAGRLYRSGDLGRWLPTGELEYLGRIDDQVQLRGYRIELGEIDACLGDHGTVAQAVTLLREDRPGDKRLTSYVVPQPEADTSAADLKAHVGRSLPEYMVPSAVVVLDALPLTLNGKIDRRALPAPEIQGEDLGVAFVAPRTPTETTLAAHWAEVLGVERVGAQDDFFELGGHSLLATVLLSRIRESFDVDLPLRSVFEAPTVERMGTLLDAQGSAETARPAGPTLPPIPATDRREGPLSFDQESIWFFQGLKSDSPAYNVPVRMSVSGPLSEQHLGAALVELARRHEALRTSFEDRDGEPVQLVTERVPDADELLRVVDLTDRSPDDARAERERLAQAEAATLFDLTRAPLLRALLLRTGADEAELVVNVHHLVVDGWSHGRLLDELLALYGALAEGRDLPPARPAARMLDYAVWQRDLFPESEAWKEELAWWTQELDGAPPVIELPTDRPRPPQQRFEGGSERVPLSRAVADGLRALARDEGATLFHVTLAAYQALLHRVTHQEDLLVGAPIAKRTQRELEHAIGNVINTVALRSRVTRETTLRELIAQAKETMLGVDAHQDLPWEAIVQALDPERSPSTTPLVQVGFTLRDKGREQAAGGARFGIPSELSNGTTKSDLTVVVEEVDGDLLVLADYPKSLYEPETVRRFLGWYAQLLEAFVTDPSTELRRARYLTPAEYEELVVTRNRTEVPYARDAAVHHAFEEQVQRTPEAVALIDGDRRVTFAELNAEANRWAHLLLARGVGPEELVGLCADRSAAAVAGLLGILKAGGAYLPLDPEYPRARLELMLNDAQPRFVLTESGLHESIPRAAGPDGAGWSGELLDLDAPPAELAAQATDDPPHTTNGDSLFNVLYTSGSTGRPKGVQLVHRAFVNRIDWQRRNIPWGRGEVASQKTTFNFVDSIPELFAPLSHGIPQVMVPDRILKDPAVLVPLLAKHKVTRVGSVPALVRTLLETFPKLSKKLPRAKYWMVGGDAIPLDLAQSFAKALPKAELWNLYGASEVEGDVLIHCANERLAPSGVPSGRAVQNTQVYLLDDELEPVGEGVVGKIFAGGDCLSRGYINQPELTASAFLRDPFSDDPEARLYGLGDLGRWMPTGEIEYLGRADNQISLRGYRVELGEVEGTLLLHPDVGMAIAMGQEDSGGNLRLVAYVSPSDAGKSLSETALAQFLSDELPHYMVPSLFVVLDAFPLTPNGKVDRRALPDAKDARPVTAAATPDKPEPENEVQRLLIEIWTEVLGVDEIGILDDFFELGGHSLLAVKLVNKVNDVFGAKLPLGSLVNAPTIRAQSQALDGEIGTEETDCLVKIQEGGDRVPFFCVCSIGGTVLNQRPLARRLGPEQPFYGLQAVDLDAKLGREATLEEFAAHYVERIKKVRPEGPYRLGGHSFGAMVAYEMAVQLEAAGDEVDLVAIFDSGPPNIPQGMGDRVAGVGVFLRGLPTIPADFYERWKQDPERFRREVSHRARFTAKSLAILARNPRAKHGRYSDGTPIPSAEAAAEFAQGNASLEATATAGPSTGGVTVDDYLDFTEWPERYRDIARRHSRAVRNYKPGRYGGRITLYRSKRQPLLFGRGMRLGWERVAAGGVDVQTVPGNHLSILAEPHVDVLAAKLRVALGID